MMTIMGIRMLPEVANNLKFTFFYSDIRSRGLCEPHLQRLGTAPAAVGAKEPSANVLIPVELWP
ncbi:hypothetical protein BRAS3843_2960032 [Bradyrhizobium sp. STM 3843]|nr:hypothetical protein BRAS3843_2960032 [Bradyrhizobium sp. STM 3843]